MKSRFDMRMGFALVQPRPLIKMVPVPPPTRIERAKRATWGFLKETAVFVGLYVQTLFRIALTISLMAFGAWFALLLYRLLF